MRFAPITLILLSTLALVTSVDPDDELRTHVSAHVDHTESAKQAKQPLRAELFQSATESLEMAQRVARQQNKLPDPDVVDPNVPASLNHHAHQFTVHTRKAWRADSDASVYQRQANDATERDSAINHTMDALQQKAKYEAHQNRAAYHQKELFDGWYIHHHPEVKSHFDPNQPDAHLQASLAHSSDSARLQKKSHDWVGDAKYSFEEDKAVQCLKRAAETSARSRKHKELSDDHKAQSQGNRQDRGRRRSA